MRLCGERLRQRRKSRGGVRSGRVCGSAVPAGAGRSNNSRGRGADLRGREAGERERKERKEERAPRGTGRAGSPRPAANGPRPPSLLVRWRFARAAAALPHGKDSSPRPGPQGCGSPRVPAVPVGATGGWRSPAREPSSPQRGPQKQRWRVAGVPRSPGCRAQLAWLAGTALRGSTGAGGVTPGSAALGLGGAVGWWPCASPGRLELQADSPETGRALPFPLKTLWRNPPRCKEPLKDGCCFYKAGEPVPDPSEGRGEGLRDIRL